MIAKKEISGASESRRWLLWMALSIAFLLGIATAAFARESSRQPEPVLNGIQKCARSIRLEHGTAAVSPLLAPSNTKCFLATALRTLAVHTKQPYQACGEGRVS
jgi:hypothetical protein